MGDPFRHHELLIWEGDMLVAHAVAPDGPEIEPDGLVEGRLEIIGFSEGRVAYIEYAGSDGSGTRFEYRYEDGQVVQLDVRQCRNVYWSPDVPDPVGSCSVERTYAYRYADGRLDFIEVQLASGSAWIEDVETDEAGRVVRHESVNGRDWTVQTFAYDAAGGVIEQTLDSGDPGLDRIVRFAYAEGRITRYELETAAGINEAHEWTWDDAGRLRGYQRLAGVEGQRMSSLTATPPCT